MANAAKLRAWVRYIIFMVFALPVVMKHDFANPADISQESNKLKQFQTSNDLERRQIRIRLRKTQFQAFHRFQQQTGDHQIALRLRIGRHHIPRRMVDVGFADRHFIGVLVFVPQFALCDVAGIELPLLVRIIEALLQALALLFLRDVQEYLDDDGAGLGQHPLEVADLRVAPRALLLVDQFLHQRHDDIFVVAAIEDRNLALDRHLLMHAPQVIVL